MPIKPENVKRYPPNWKQIRERILERAGHKCEQCGVPNYAYRIKSVDRWTFNEDEAYAIADHDKDVTRIVLTISHTDHVIENCGDENLRALCQRDHLAHDQDHHQHTAYATRRQGKAIGDLLDD